MVLGGGGGGGGCYVHHVSVLISLMVKEYKRVVVVYLIMLVLGGGGGGGGSKCQPIFVYEIGPYYGQFFTNLSSDLHYAHNTPLPIINKTFFYEFR